MAGAPRLGVHFTAHVNGLELAQCLRDTRVSLLAAASCDPEIQCLGHLSSLMHAGSILQERSRGAAPLEVAKLVYTIKILQ